MTPAINDADSGITAPMIKVKEHSQLVLAYGSTGIEDIVEGDTGNGYRMTAPILTYAKALVKQKREAEP